MAKKIKPKKIKTYKCRYSHCLHDGEPVFEQDAVKVSNKYYHIDCLKEKEVIDEIISYFFENVDSTAIASMLRKVVNKIVYENHVDPKFLLFALKKFAEENKIKYPGGLYYAVKDGNVKKEWDKLQSSKIKEEARKDDSFVLDVDSDEYSNFSYKTTNKNNFSSIFGG